MGEAGRINQRQSPPPARGRLLTVWVSPLAAVFAWAVAITLLLVLLGPVRAVLLGLLAASAVAALLRPIARALPGPRTLKGALTGLGFILIAIALAATLVQLLARPIRRELEQWTLLQARIDQSLLNLTLMLGLEHTLTVEGIIGGVVEFFGGAGAELMSMTTSAVAGVVISIVFVFVGSLYLLIEPPGGLSGPVVRMFPERHRPALVGFLGAVEPRLRWWALGAMASMTLVGTLAYVGYLIIGLEFALPLALLMGLGELVPTFGPITAFAVALLFASGQGTSEMVGVVVVYLIVQATDGYVVMPLIMKRAVRIPPAVTLFTIVLWARIFGVGGLLLAVPINLVLWSLAEQFLLDRGGSPVQERGPPPSPPLSPPKTVG